MYYVKTRADNSGYTNHRVICLVVIGLIVNKYSKFQMDTFDSFWEMDSDKKLNRPRRWRRSDDNSSTFFLRKVEQKIPELALNNKQHSLTQTNNSYWSLTFHCCVCHHTQLQCLYLLLLDYFLINIDKDPENELKNIKNWLNIEFMLCLDIKDYLYRNTGQLVGTRILSSKTGPECMILILIFQQFVAWTGFSAKSTSFFMSLWNLNCNIFSPVSL
jgi:hypothetical protein